MNISNRWIPFIISIILEPLTLLLAFTSSGAGHGNYWWAKLFFPYTMLSAYALNRITLPFILLALLELPIYGFFLGTGWIAGKLKLYGILIFVSHALAVLLCFVIASENFS